MPPPPPSAPLSIPAQPSAATSPAAAAATTRRRWLRGRALGGRRAERACRCRSVDPAACSALDGPARWRPGASTRRRGGASALLRVDAPAPRRPGTRCQRRLCPPAGMAGAPRSDEIELLHDKPKPRLCAGSNDWKNYAEITQKLRRNYAEITQKLRKKLDKLRKITRVCVICVIFIIMHTPLC